MFVDNSLLSLSHLSNSNELPLHMHPSYDLPPDNHPSPKVHVGRSTKRWWTWAWESKETRDMKKKIL